MLLVYSSEFENSGSAFEVTLHTVQRENQTAMKFEHVSPLHCSRQQRLLYLWMMCLSEHNDTGMLTQSPSTYLIVMCAYNAILT